MAQLLLLLQEPFFLRVGTRMYELSSSDGITFYSLDNILRVLAVLVLVLTRMRKNETKRSTGASGSRRLRLGCDIPT
jgi:hypothetical protein